MRFHFERVILQQLEGHASHSTELATKYGLRLQAKYLLWRVSSVTYLVSRRFHVVENIAIA